MQVHAPHRQMLLVTIKCRVPVPACTPVCAGRGTAARRTSHTNQKPAVMHSTLHAGAPCSCRGPDQHAVRSSEAHSRSHINRPGKVRLCLGVSPTFLSSHVPPWRSTKQHTRRCSHATPVLSGCPPLVAHNCGVPNTSPLSTVGTQCERCAPNPAEVQTCHSSTTKQGPALTHMPQQLWQLAAA